MKDNMSSFDIAREWISSLSNAGLTCFSFVADDELSVVAGTDRYVTIATSQRLLPNNHILLGVDMAAPQRLMVGLNDFHKGTRFYVSPSESSLVQLEKILIHPAMDMPQMSGQSGSSEVQRTAGVISLKDRNKKETTVFMGLGDWDDMAEMENQMASNRYISPFPLARATAPGRDGAASQYYSVFSASLCSLIRTRALEETLFYMHIEYLSAPADMMHSLQHGHPDNFFLKTLPNDLPVDVAALLLENEGCQETMPQLIEDVYNENFESLQVLCVLSHLVDRFDEIFMLLASHPNQRFRDQIAQEAFFNRSHRVYEEVKKHGISPDILRSLEPDSRPASQ
ncbi:MAG: hypothetical protein JXX14_14810 [Deltaproteobacteria bacterium]|nr:hypothetical protein [Deltaproteobacteria bacterium]